MDGPKVLIRVSLVLAAATLSWGVDLAQDGPGAVPNSFLFMRRGVA